MNKDCKRAVIIAFLVLAFGSTANADTKVDCSKSTICTVVVKNSSFSMGFQI